MSYSNGMKLFRSGDYGGALEIFQTILEENQEDSKSWNALGVTLSKLGDTENALICLENAINLDPTNAKYERNYRNIKNKKPHKMSEKSHSPGYSKFFAQKKIFLGIGIVFAIILLIIVLIPVIDEFINGSQKPTGTSTGPKAEVKNGEIRMIFKGSWGIDSAQSLSYSINGNTDFSPIEKPQKDIIYSIVDPYPSETKLFTMIVTYPDGSQTIIYHRELPPQ